MIWKFHAIFTRNVNIFFAQLLHGFHAIFFGNPSPHPSSHPVGQEGTLQQHLQLDQLHDQVNRRIQKHWHLWPKRQPDFRPRSPIRIRSRSCWRPILQDPNTTSQPRDHPEVSQCGWPPQNRPLSKTGPKHHEKPPHWQTIHEVSRSVRSKYPNYGNILVHCTVCEQIGELCVNPCSLQHWYHPCKCRGQTWRCVPKDASTTGSQSTVMPACTATRPPQSVSKLGCQLSLISVSALLTLPTSINFLGTSSRVRVMAYEEEVKIILTTEIKLKLHRKILKLLAIED